MRQIFDPRERFAAISELPKHETESFWIERAKQRIGIATVAALILEEVLSRPESTEEELLALVMEAGEELSLADYQHSIAKDLVRSATRRRHRISSFQEKFPSPEKHFQDVTRVHPMEHVERSFHTLTIHFKIDPESYKRVRLSSNELSAGFFMPSRPEYTFQKGYLGDDGIRIHEETHALYFMLREVLQKHLGEERLERPYPDLGKMVKRIQHEQMDTLIKAFARAYILAASDRIKDEILAFSRQAPRSQRQTVNTLLQPADERGLYDYFHRVRERADTQIRRTFPADQAHWALTVLDEELRKQQKRLVEDGVAAVKTLLQRHHFTPEMVLFYLSDSPLERWPKETDLLYKLP